MIREIFVRMKEKTIYIPRVDKTERKNHIQIRNKSHMIYIINVLLTTLSELCRHLAAQKSKTLEYFPAKRTF